MPNSWEKPDFQAIEVNGECTAYAGAKADWQTKAGGLGAPGQVPVAFVPAAHPWPGEGPQGEETPDR
jgi:hypothetical protein